MYSLFELKLKKLKKYLKKNLQKKFIVSSQTTYVSLVLFAIKFNDQLRLCVNYRRLNHITKRNRYFIFLIEKTLIKIQNCKYLIKLNIISTFNKLRMNEKSEKLITFVISMKSYKYRILSFELINDFANWQHYMNDFLFNFLNEFCQVYLNDIFIYNNFKKKTYRSRLCNAEKTQKSRFANEYWELRILQEKNDLSRRDTLRERFSHEFEKNKSHNQLSTFYKSQENISLCEFRQFLSTFHSWFFEKNQNSHSNDQEVREIRMNCWNRRNFQSFQENDDKNFHISSLWSNQASHFENRLFKLR